MVNTHTVQK